MIEKREPRPTIEWTSTGMSEQAGETFDDGQPEPETLLLFVTGRLEAHELGEDTLMPIGRNARTAVHDLDPQRFASATAKDDNPAAPGVSNGVRYEVAEDALQKYRVARNPGRCSRQAKGQSLADRLA